MKKSLCFILALTMCISAFSCSDKKKDSKPEPDITEEEVALEKPFFTMEKEEFSKISVTPTRSEETPPVTLESIDIESLDFGARVPICTQNHDYEKYHQNSSLFPYTFYSSLDDVDQSRPYGISEQSDGTELYYQLELDANAEEFVYSSQKGNVRKYSIEGDTAYMAVSFEPDSTSESHEWSVFTYDILTGKLDEIYTYSSLENPISLYFSRFAGGKFWYLETYYTKSEMLNSKIQNDSTESETAEEETPAKPKVISTLYAIDLETKETTEVYSSEKYFGYSTGDGMLIHEYQTNDDSEYNVIKSIDTDTYEVTEMYSFPMDAAASTYFASNGIGAYLDKHEGSRTLDIVTPNYRIDTGLRNGEPIYADDNCFIVMVSDNYSSVLHYYDIEQKIHYTIDTANYGSQAYYCNGGVILTHSSNVGAPVYYVIPDLGLFFELVGFSGSTEGLQSVTDDDGETYYEYADEGIRIDDFNTNSGSVSFSGHSTVKLNLKEHNTYSFDVINTIYHISGKSEK